MRQAGEGGSAVVRTQQPAGARISIAIGTSRRQRGSRALARDAPIHWRVGVETLGDKRVAIILYGGSRQTTICKSSGRQRNAPTEEIGSTTGRTGQA